MMKHIPLRLRAAWLGRKIQYYYYKYILRLDIVGFRRGIPVIRSKYLVEDEKE